MPTRGIRRKEGTSARVTALPSQAVLAAGGDMRRLREGLTGLVFVSDGRAVPVSFAVAASRLEELVRGRLLDGVSERVYEGGVEYLLRVGPAGSVPGFSRLVRVRFAEQVHLDGAVSVALRLEATGAVGGLFPALDADIRLPPTAETTAG